MSSSRRKKKKKNKIMFVLNEFNYFDEPKEDAQKEHKKKKTE